MKAKVLAYEDAFSARYSETELAASIGFRRRAYID